MMKETKQGEYIQYDDTDKITKIEWYTDGKLDCSLEVSDGNHSYKHGDGNIWQKYTIKGGKPDGEWIIYHPGNKVWQYRKF